MQIDHKPKKTWSIFKPAGAWSASQDIKCKSGINITSVFSKSVHEPWAFKQQVEITVPRPLGCGTQEMRQDIVTGSLKSVNQQELVQGKIKILPSHIRELLRPWLIFFALIV